MNVRIVIGIILTGIALTLYGVGKPKLSKEKTFLDKALEGHDSEVFLQGIVDNANDTIQNFFVIASKEEFTGAGKHNGFKPVEKKLQPVKLQTKEGQETLLFKEVPYRGDEIAHILLEEKTSSNAPIQWQGIKRGTPLLVLGHRESNGDVAVKYSYAGTEENYFNFLEEGVVILTQICTVLAAVGIPLLIWGLVKK